MSDNRNIPGQDGQKGMNAGKSMNPNAAKDECGPSRRVSDIQPHMDVVSSCGCTMGKVDRLEGEAIKLTRNDSPDGKHHFIPTGWVDRVDEHVHLNKDAEETRQGWKSDAASCSNCNT